MYRISQPFGQEMLSYGPLMYRAIASGVGGDNLKIVRKVCENTDVDTATAPEDVWGGGGLYTGFPADSVTPEKFAVFSSSANDTAAGTGARTVLITGLDSSYNEISETITLNGVTPVLTANTYRRFVRAQVLTSDGTPTNSAFNAGTITIRYQTTTAYVFSVMPAGYNNTREGNYTIPAGYSALLMKIDAYVNLASSAVVYGEFYIRPFGVSPRLSRPFVASDSLQFTAELTGGLLLSEKTDIIPRVMSSSANNVPIYCVYELLLFKP